MSNQYLHQELIRKKRDGHILSNDEIGFMVKSITDHSLSDVQLGAFAMAVFMRGMSMDERVSLTKHMMNSGDVMSWGDLSLNGPVVDKHSTGGVGDKISLMLAPIVAACGVFVPMVSGRGLGHTGGTLDKMESIPGFDAFPEKEKIRQIVKNVGCVIVGQTAQIAPADRRFYATRDVTATVESIDLITASILSKKLAEGLDALVMDVKTGSGAFAAEISMAKELAESIANVASGAGVTTNCLITDMNQVLGRNVGNALEVKEAIDFLKNPDDADQRLLELTLALASEMLHLSGVEKNKAEAKAKALRALQKGSAAEIFEKMVATQGGPNDLINNTEKYLPACEIVEPIKAGKAGYISQMDVRQIGISMISINAGRSKADEKIDYQVGLSDVVELGQYIEEGQTLALAHVHNSNQSELLEKILSKAIEISDEKPDVSPLIYQTIAGNN